MAEWFGAYERVGNLVEEREYDSRLFFGYTEKERREGACYRR